VIIVGVSGTVQGQTEALFDSGIFLFNGLSAAVESDIPEELYTPDAVDYCFERFGDMYPIQEWLVGMMARVTQ
jgi:hypothetical protein